jgi:hypothetical protein
LSLINFLQNAINRPVSFPVPHFLQLFLFLLRQLRIYAKYAMMPAEIDYQNARGIDTFMLNINIMKKSIPISKCTISLLSLFFIATMASCKKEDVTGKPVTDKPVVDKQAFFTIKIDSKEYTTLVFDYINCTLRWSYIYTILSPKCSRRSCQPLS